MSDYARYFTEAFSKLRLVEKDFDISKEALDGIQKWKDNDANPSDSLADLDVPEEDGVETLEVADPEAWDEKDIKDDYVGNVILECTACHKLIVVPKDEVYEDDDAEACCTDIKCPYCNGELGYNVVGKIEHFDAAEGDSEEEDDWEAPDDDEKVEDTEKEDEKNESLQEKIRRKNLQEAKKEVCSNCGKEPCECESLEEGAPVAGHESKPNAGRRPSEEEFYEQNHPGKKFSDLSKEEKKEAYEEYYNQFFPEGLANKKNSAKLKEALNNLSLDTDDQHLEISADESGRISVISDPTPSMETPDYSTAMPGEDSIVPLDAADMEAIDSNMSPEDQEDILDTNAEMEPVTDEDTSAEDELTSLEGEEAGPEDEEAGLENEEELGLENESFDYLSNIFTKKLYENVRSYKTTSHTDAGDKFIIEGIITFNSGNTKPTKFIFENARETRGGRLVMEGSNPTFAPGKIFRLRGDVADGNFIAESLKYNYTIGKLNESTGQTDPIAVRGIIRGK